MADMPILDRYNIGGRKRLVDEVIFRGGVPDISKKLRNTRESGYLGCMHSHFWSQMGPLMVRFSTYANFR